MNIRIGTQAPDFAADAYLRGNPDPVRLSLADQRGKWVVLFFYPRDFAAICPTELRALAALQARFSGEDVVVLAASTDGFASHRAWFESDPRLADIAFPVIADATQRIARAFGILHPSGAALRGSFVIDPRGVIRHVEVTDADLAHTAGGTLLTLEALRARTPELGTPPRRPISTSPGRRPAPTGSPA